VWNELEWDGKSQWWDDDGKPVVVPLYAPDTTDPFLGDLVASGLVAELEQRHQVGLISPTAAFMVDGYETLYPWQGLGPGKR
jgi:hypothetical protein